MVTLVGTQTDFKDALVSLIELEYDAIGAYRLAVSKLSAENYKNQLSLFLVDHERHLVDLKKYCSQNQINAPESGDMVKGMMAKLKVFITDLIGSDINILKAMLDNELDTNTAYERINKHAEKPMELQETLFQAYEDEKNHKFWLTNQIEING